MAKGNDDYPSVQNFMKKKTKMDFCSWYEQIQEGCPSLIENKKFWTRKGNSQKVTCSLCNIGVELSKNTNVLKRALLSHVENKYHKKRYEAFLSPDTKSSKQDYEKQEEFNYKEKPEDNYDVSKDPNQADSLVFVPVIYDFDTIYDCFDKYDPVIKTSKQFIAKNYDNNDYFCSLCKETIVYSTEMHEFRYNLWTHMNKESHREKFPIYEEVEKKFQNTMLYLSEKHALHLKLLKCFKIGPALKYVSCSLCQLAIHTKPESLLNHLKGYVHQRNVEAKRQKRKEIKEGTWKEPDNIPTLAEKTQTAFQTLMAKIDMKFKEQLKFIEPGKMPGYVVCKVCSLFVPPIKNCIETHIEYMHNPYKHNHEFTISSYGNAK